jgi:DNA-binding winged helix-turn-helix (wHTH) protein
MLVENEGAMVSREEIRKRLWPNDTIVEFEHSINAAINKLRKALGDPVAEPQYIQTVARRGYRLMVPVEWEMPAGNESSSGEISSSDVVIPKGFPWSVGGVESRLLGFPCFHTLSFP